MEHSVAKRALTILLSVSLALSACMPATVALAESYGVQIQNHTQADGRTTVGNVRVDGVDAPKAGAPLDNTAKVVADPSAVWDIPVLWVSNDLALATEAEAAPAAEPAPVVEAAPAAEVVPAAKQPEDTSWDSAPTPDVAQPEGASQNAA